MRINTELAQKIVESLRDTIEQDINFIDNDGIIIASTDHRRINSLHEGALACIKEGKTIAINSDNQYTGARKGVNLPVKFQNEIIGVIGISGDLDVVEKYGDIIKKMTEILLKEEWINENASADIENKKLIVESILNSNLYKLDFLPKNLDSDAKNIAVSIVNYDSLDFSTRKNLIRFTEANFANNKLYVTFLQNRFVIIYLDSDYSKINDHLNLLINQASKSYKVNLNFGVSNTFHKISNSKTFYDQAIRSQKWSEYKGRQSPVVFYNDMELGLLLTSLDDKDLYEYSYKVLKDIDLKELKEYKELFLLYGKYNGSISAIADEMFMHKNTIQYRLNKLESMTGYNPRNYNDYLVLWFAFFNLKID